MIKFPLTFSLAAVGATLVLAACGGSNGNGDEATASGSSSSSGGGTVSTKSIDGQDVLVNSDGAALYVSDQEKDGMVRCTASCTSEWLPLTAGAAKPTGTSGLDVVKRPDGSRQVTLDGRPVYRFVEDGGPGKVTGDGFSDSFGGQDFTWHVLTSKGASTKSGSDTSSGGNGY